MAQKKRHPCCVSKDEFVSRQTGEEGLLIPGVQKQVLNGGERCPFAVEKDHHGGIVEIHSMRRLLQRLRDCIQKTLNEWSSQISPDLVREFPDVLECTVSHAVEKINPDEREEMKVSAKLFIVGSNSSSSTRNAVDMACSVLGVAQLDSVIIASPPIEDGVNLSLEHLQPYWEELENLVQSKKIVAIGTSDLDKTQLEQLYQWAQVKPNSNQVNLASCCVMPPDLTAFAKQFDIQLLTHNDPKELLSEASFQEALQESIPDIQAHELTEMDCLKSYFED
ncbi:glutamate--cysteine ligase regulatory subunit [Puma concolor]|uniref:Glutamate--cysteine ligase regulatory subunit n=1 Tax=Puma concolor TaxID=9696 RepID=A0A6P6I504_PUMCO|nr:glutamate--cysteine ligase regulatory subunit [Puma concolor]